MRNYNLASCEPEARNNDSNSVAQLINVFRLLSESVKVQIHSETLNLQHVHRVFKMSIRPLVGHKCPYDIQNIHS